MREIKILYLCISVVSFGVLVLGFFWDGEVFFFKGFVFKGVGEGVRLVNY